MGALGRLGPAAGQQKNRAPELIRQLLRRTTKFTAIFTMCVGLYVTYVFSADIYQIGSTSSVSTRYFQVPNDKIDLASVASTIDSPGADQISVFEREPEQALVMEILPHDGEAIHKREQLIEIRLVQSEHQRIWIVPIDSEPLGSIGRRAHEISSSIQYVPSGMVFSIPAQAAPYRILMAMETSALWKPKVYLWADDGVNELSSHFDRFGGALLGVFAGLAAFSAMIAALNRQITYMLFSAWLLTSLRLAGMNGGWGLNWVGIELSDSATLLFMQMSLAVHGMLSCGLFLVLFGRALGGSKLRGICKTVMTAFTILAFTAPVIPYPVFMLGFYITAAVTVQIFVFGSAYVLYRQPSWTAGWYLGSYTVWMLGILSEIFYQAGFFQSIASVINIQTSSILSALIMGIALAERMRHQEKLTQRAQTGELKALQTVELNYQNTPVALFSLTSDSGLRLSNRAFRELFSLAADVPMAEVSLKKLLGEQAFQDLCSALKSNDEISISVCSSRPSEEVRWFDFEISRRGEYFEGSVVDVTARKEAEARLIHLVDHEALTGALNRRGYEAALATALSERLDGQALLLADINIVRIAHLSNLYGSSVVEQIFLELHRLIQANFRAAQIARIGGDSFRLIFANTQAAAMYPSLVAFANLVAHSSLVPHRPALSVAIKIGLLEVTREIELDQAQNYLAQASTLARHDEESPVAMLTDEDQALAQGFESMKAFDQIDSMALDETFFLVMQPIVPVADPTQKIKFEVLLRMRSESGGLIRPDKFIPAAEEAGIMNRIDRWVLVTSLDLMDQNPAFCEQVDVISVNLSGGSLNDQAFVDDLMVILSDRKHLASKLCLEITETVALNNVDRTRRILETIRLLGVRVALDDFGSGYTGWGYLQHLPADILKLDGSIVRDCITRSVDRLIIKSAVELANELDMDCVAEMAETLETVELLQSLGVSYIQGYYFAKPLEISEILLHQDDLQQLLLSPVPAMKARPIARAPSLELHGSQISF